MNDPVRCPWSMSDPLYINYHDTEWGVPIHDDRLLFEFLVREGERAGLSCRTILLKRDNYRLAFDRFDPATVAAYDEAKVAELLANPGIVRNRLKINSAIRNARGFGGIQSPYGSFDQHVWGFVDGRPHINHWESLRQVPAETTESRTLSKLLKPRRLHFVRPTSIYA